MLGETITVGDMLPILEAIDVVANKAFVDPYEVVQGLAEALDPDNLVGLTARVRYLCQVNMASHTLEGQKELDAWEAKSRAEAA